VKPGPYELPVYECYDHKADVNVVGAMKLIVGVRDLAVYFNRGRAPRKAGTVKVDELIYHHEDLDAVVWNGKRYGVLDLRVTYPWDTGRYRLTFTAEVRNLFDREYSDVFDAPMPRRWFMAGVKVQRH